MKKTVLITIGVLLFLVSSSQTYFPFPTDTARWNCLFWHQWSPNDIHLSNTQYQLQGDTSLNNQLYHKIYYIDTDFSGNPEYIGGMREDSAKNIFFFPASINLPTPAPISFPDDTSEHLLYTFDNLDSGMVLPINTGFTEIKVIGVDSVLMNDIYRKRYKIENSAMLFQPEYWIEGIGSTKDLLSPFTNEFEWELFTLCFSDTITYFIHSPNGDDSCHYSITVGIRENMVGNFIIYPNPASERIVIKAPAENDQGIVNIYNSQAQLILTDNFIDSKAKIDISKFNPGIFIAEIITENRKAFVKFIKN